MLLTENAESVVSKAATPMKELHINTPLTAKPSSVKVQPARFLTRHGSVSNIIDVSSQDVLNSRAIEVINRIQSKLNGRDFFSHLAASESGGHRPASTVEQQVERLIAEATSVENLCQLFVGWCPFW